MWSGRCRSACLTRSRISTGVSVETAPASNRRQLARSILSSSVSSMATIRSSSGSSSISAFRSVVLPEPVPPGDEDVEAGPERTPGGPKDFFGQRAHAHEIVCRERTSPEPAYGDRDLGTRGRGADRDPRPVFETCVQDRLRGRIEPERAGDVDRRPVEPGGGECGRVVGLQPPRPLDPDVAGSVDHDFGDLRVPEQGLQARQERGQMADAAGALHIRPSSRSRQ